MAAVHPAARNGKDGQRNGAQNPPSYSHLPLLSQLQAQKLRLAYTRSSHYGGSLPNVNQIGCGLAEFQVSGHEPRIGRGSQAASLADLPVALAEPSPLTFGFITEHSAPWAGGTGAERPPQDGVPTPPISPPHILPGGCGSRAGVGRGSLETQNIAYFHPFPQVRLYPSVESDSYLCVCAGCCDRKSLHLRLWPPLWLVLAGPTAAHFAAQAGLPPPAK